MNAEEQLAQARHAEILRAIEGIHLRLDLLNGRTRTVEQKVAVTEAKVTAIEAAGNGSGLSVKASAGIAALIAGVIAGLAQVFANLNNFNQ
jgi:hypothetical protein